MKMRPPVPILRSYDEAATRAFYIGFLGFTVAFEHRFDDDAPLYLALKRGDCVLHISEHHGDASPGAAIRIEVDDVHVYCRDLNAKNYRYARPGVQRQSWGSDDMKIDDPAGNRMIFFTEIDT